VLGREASSQQQPLEHQHGVGNGRKQGCSCCILPGMRLASSSSSSGGGCNPAGSCKLARRVSCGSQVLHLKQTRQHIPRTSCGELLCLSDKQLLMGCLR
jgi:hypothetical protein